MAYYSQYYAGILGSAIVTVKVEEKKRLYLDNNVSISIIAKYSSFQGCSYTIKGWLPLTILWLAGH